MWPSYYESSSSELADSGPLLFIVQMSNEQEFINHADAEWTEKTMRHQVNTLE